ncbi:MAG: deoxyuridine 5'-triphosphate nucleotidohydrolase [Candidatus Omnitrophota bacterium]|nr:MAG: deoxyuridine 5'-triphosphate nucleotidohydrolase [Candidatus Omnitrophota bacterium]
MLSKKEVRQLIEKEKLVENYMNLDIQLTPNGIDLTVGKIFEFTSQGSLDFSNKERVVPEGGEVLLQKRDPHDERGWWHLAKGTYKARTNEVVNLPNNIVALAFSRTSLLRMGAFTQHGVWDAGFRGKGEFILSVENLYGIQLKENVRIAQLVFFRIDETEGYNGIYKNLK